MSAITPSSAPARWPSGMRLTKLAFVVWTVGVLIFLYVPILVLAAYSFNASRLNIVWTGFTWQWYRDVWSNAPLMHALQNSLIIALATTAISVVLGTSGAWLMHRYRFRGPAWMHTLIALPMMMPEIIMGISLLIFFTSLSVSLGFFTVIIAHVTFCFPFVLIAVRTRLMGLDPALEEAALDLGATPLQAFWFVIVPFLRPAIVAGALMAFTLSMDEVVVTYFTASPGSATLPLKIFGMAKAGLNPMLNALSFLFIVATAGLVLFTQRLKSFAR